MNFKIEKPEYKGCDECPALEHKMELHCKTCEEDGLIELHFLNRQAWELAESIRALGSELAITLRGGLKLTLEEAWWLEIRLRLIINYMDGQEKLQDFRFAQTGLGSILGGSDKAKTTKKFNPNLLQ